MIGTEKSGLYLISEKSSESQSMQSVSHKDLNFEANDGSNDSVCSVYQE